ncbi:MAG: UDP-glucose 4-epimerase GalE [Crocinitomicaceae bacterium]|nr:UDP-glucose 4-epimerase GalE [Crocinitomicaceae bacterium]
MKKKILVTGGLGFIGSHTVVCLHEAGFEPIIIDNLSNSQMSAMDGIKSLIGFEPTFVNANVNNKEVLTQLIVDHKPEAIIHFAAFKAVGESVEKPLMYYENNVVGLISVLEVMKEQGIANLVFSSSCTVYGEPDQVPVLETTPTKPAQSPYGATKQMGEIILRDNAAWCKTQCLRYFNPIGAHPTAALGELPLGIPNNLIPYLTQTVAGLRNELTVFGNDYDTPDGTCIRDYIHVMDLAEAHVKAVERLVHNKQAENFEVFNIGTGNGFSVLEVIHSFEKENNIKVPHKIGPRRAGDVVKVWADTTKVNQVLGWTAKRGLDEMMRDSWNWQLKLQKG